MLGSVVTGGRVTSERNVVVVTAWLIVVEVVEVVVLRVGTVVVVVVLVVEVELVVVLVVVLVAVGIVVVGAVVVEVVVEVVVGAVVVVVVVGADVLTTSACAPAMLFAPLGTSIDTIALPAMSCGAAVNAYD